MASGLGSMQGTKTVLLTTYRRNGTPVATPVSLAFEGDRAFVRSFDRAGKVKRLFNNPAVELAPATFRGKPTGPAVRAQATLVPDADAQVAARALARRHRVLQGLIVPIAHRLMRYRTMHYELRADDDPSGNGGGASG
jgi:PPOX class probable F420-dependent enzyme